MPKIGGCYQVPIKNSARRTLVTLSFTVNPQGVDIINETPVWHYVVQYNSPAINNTFVKLLMLRQMYGKFYGFIICGLVSNILFTTSVQKKHLKLWPQTFWQSQQKLNCHQNTRSGGDWGFFKSHALTVMSGGHLSYIIRATRTFGGKSKQGLFWWLITSHVALQCTGKLYLSSLVVT